MLTLLEVLQRTTAYLEGKGVETPRLDAEWLLAGLLGLKRLDLYVRFERPMQEAELEALRPLVRRRGAREPLQHVLGETEFHGLTLKTDRRALIPRPETERLVELILKRTAVPPVRLLDLGTGTGALALALLRAWPEVVAVAVDRSEAAIELAGENAHRLQLADRVEFRLSDWYGGLGAVDKFDLIVANPPYLTRDEWEVADPEVKDYEPREALEAARAGRADLETIIVGAAGFLASGGRIALETGVAQHQALSALAREQGFTEVETVRDYHGRDRYLFLSTG